MSIYLYYPCGNICGYYPLKYKAQNLKDVHITYAVLVKVFSVLQLKLNFVTQG